MFIYLTLTKALPTQNLAEPFRKLCGLELIAEVDEEICFLGMVAIA